MNTMLNTNTIRTAAAANVTADHLADLVAAFDTTGDTARAVNAFARSLVADYAPAASVTTLPTLGHRGSRSTAAYSSVAGGKNVAVFLGKRVIVASGVLHADGSLTVNGTTHGSPSAAQSAVAIGRGKAVPRVSGWAKWLFIDSDGVVRPIERIREGGVEQNRSKTAGVEELVAARATALKKIARREAKGTTITAPGVWGVCSGIAATHIA